ncbi:MAG: pyrroline-5-carboxylate reductase [Victivallaceae bacterium]|nr:pyrroline-5-carboxylate reductase [Victivallaceae bacterium]
MKLLFVGAGKMATAIAGGLVANQVFRADELAAFDVSEKAAAEFTRHTGVACSTADCAGLAAKADNALLAVKPQNLRDAMKAFDGALAGKTVISIVAGVPIAKISELTGSHRVVRVMPNTPALVGCGAAALAKGPEAADSDLELAEKIFSAVGLALKVDEKYLDAVTALSGSGPAYVFAFIQALSDGGVATGLARDTATKLAIRTVLGAAKMAEVTGLHPTVLKDQVTSPGGTTIRALEVLEDRAMTGAVIAAVKAAAERSAELGRG